MTTLLELVEGGCARWDDAETVSRIGQELEDRSRFPAARRFLERALALRPSDVDAWLHLGYANHRSLRTEEGNAALRRGIAATGSDRLRVTLVGFGSPEEAEVVRRQIHDTGAPAVAAALISLGLWSGDAAAGLATLRDLARAHPDDEDVQSTLLWSLHGAKVRGFRPEPDLRREALPFAEARARRRPEAVMGWFMQLLLLSAERAWEELLAVTARALARLPDEESVMQYRARAFREVGDEERAEQWFQRAIGAKPDFAGARVDLGKLYEKQGRHERAEETFREVLTANPGYPLGPASLALFLWRRGRHDEAERVFLEGWPRVPDFWRASLRQNPDAREILARPAVQAAIA